MQVEVLNLSLSFGERVIFSDASLSLMSPSMAAIVGPSGSGKTSLLSVIAGSIAPDSGHVEITPATAGSPRIEWIVQSSPLLPKRTALENVMLGPLSTGQEDSHSMELSLRALQDLNLHLLSHQRVDRLSGGERQRVAVARAIAAKSKILLADEPTASLDAKSREAVCDALVAARDNGGVVVVATHDPYVAQRCDLAYSVVAGKLVQL